MMNVLITGGSGLVGRKLTQLLRDKGHSVSWLSRNEGEENGVIKYAWNIQKQQVDPKAIEKADAIIHLAGAGVADKRWTAKRKEEILLSRTESTKLLYSELKKQGKDSIPFVSASAIGFYGFSTSDAVLTENAPAGNDFLADVTKAWESEVQKISTLGHSVSMIRIGIVLAREGGALKEMTNPPVVAPLGSGKQWMPWIHIDDLCHLFIYALEQKLEGVYNGVAPKPEVHESFMKALASASKKIYVPLPAPKFVLSIALGEMANMLVNGTRVSAEKIENTGFNFTYPSLESALKQLY